MTSLLSVMSWKSVTKCSASICLLSRMGSLSCHTCCDKGALPFSSEWPTHVVFLCDKQGELRTYSNPGHDGAVVWVHPTGTDFTRTFSSWTSHWLIDWLINVPPEIFSFIHFTKCISIKEIGFGHVDIYHFEISSVSSQTVLLFINYISIYGQTEFDLTSYLGI